MALRLQLFTISTCVFLFNQGEEFRIKIVLSFILLLGFISCKEEKTFGQVEIYELAKKEDPNAKAVLGDLTETKVNLCDQMKYGGPCQKVIRASILNLQIIFVKYPSLQDAKKEALRIDQFYARNWVIDDVTGEPSLERFVIKVFDAERPTQTYVP